MSYEENFGKLRLKLPEVSEPFGAYVPAVKAGKLLFLSGILPLSNGKLAFEGKIGEKLGLEQGYEAAKIAALNALAIVKKELGSLNNVERIVRVVGYIASIEGFTAQPRVLNGASELLIKIFGENGKHARVAVGVSQLPMNSPVEIEMIILSLV